MDELVFGTFALLALVAFFAGFFDGAHKASGVDEINERRMS